MKDIKQVDVHGEALKHFSLKRDPFSWLPGKVDDFFYSTDMALVEGCLWATIHQPGICAVIGEVGSGKSSAVRRFVESDLRSKKDYVVSIVDAPQMRHLDMSHVCQKLLHDFMGDLHVGRGFMKIAEAVRETVEELAENNVRPVLIIEDAHLLGLQPLRELKLLYELRRRIRHILAIVLVGQQELASHLQREDMRQLSQRCRQYRIQGLRADLPAYLKHRCKRVGAEASDLFEPDAIRELVAHPAVNTPLEVHALCAQALNYTWKQGEARVSQALMVHVLTAHGEDERGIPAHKPAPAARTGAAAADPGAARKAVTG